MEARHVPDFSSPDAMAHGPLSQAHGLALAYEGQTICAQSGPGTRNKEVPLKRFLVLK